MAGKCKWGQARLDDLNAKLLVELADQAGFRGFAFLNLTARKLPQPCQLFTLRPFGNEHAPIDVDQRRGGDEQERRCGAQLR